MTPRYSREILPGGEGEIVLRVDTHNQRIPLYRRKAVITCNDRTKPQVNLDISGKILFVIQPDPANVRLSGLAGTALAGDLLIKPGTDLAIEVTQAKAKNSQFEVRAIEPQADGSTKILIEAAPSEMPGMLRDVLVVHVVASDGSEHHSDIPVILDHRDRITIQPRGNVVFQRRDTDPLKQPGARPARRDIQLYSSAPDIRFQVKSVEFLDVPEGVFTHEVRTIKEGERYVVSVFLPAYHDEPSIRGRLKIVTDDPSAPEKIVRLYAQFGATPRRPNPAAGARPVRPGQPVGGTARPTGTPQKGGATLKPAGKP